MARWFLGFGAVAGGLAVAAGAFGAHALRDLVPPERLATFETAVQYQMYHALALLVVGWFYSRASAHGRALAWAGRAFIAGILLFSGSLYILVLADAPMWGAVTPLGGVAFIAGWICLAIALLGRTDLEGR